MNVIDHMRENDAIVESGEIDGYQYFIGKHPCFDSPHLYMEVGYNGYIVFPKRPVRESGHNGIVQYVPVWGGITLAEETQEGEMIYGFDTGHIDQENLPIRDINWIKEQIRIMKEGLMRAKEVEAKYLRCVSKQEKIKHAQYVVDTPGGMGVGMGAMLSVMVGKI